MATVYSLVCWGGATGKTVTLSNASPCVLTNTAHGARDGLKVQFSTTGSLPSPLATNTTYYLKYTGANTCNIYTDAAMTNIVNTTTPGSGTHTAKSANMLALVASSPTKYGPTGIDRIYADSNSCNNARIANATATDDDVIEFCDPFEESRPTQISIASTGYANTTLWTSMINGVRSDAFHRWNPNNGFRAIVTGTNSAVSFAAYNVTVDGLQWCRNTASATTSGIVSISNVSAVFKNNLIVNLGAGTGPGLVVGGSETKTYNNIVIGCKGTTYGGLTLNACAGALVYNNLVTKCDLGMNANSNAGSALVYNNMSVGNTQNYGSALVYAATRSRRNIGTTEDKATFTATVGTTSLVLSSAPPFGVNQQIVLSTDGTLPTVGGVPLSSERSYFVRSIAGSTITISTIFNGSALTFDGAGTGTHTVPFGWESVSGTGLQYIDFTNPNNVFVDWANNDFRTAGTAPTPGSEAKHVDYGVYYPSMDGTDINGFARPAYKNGDPEYWDAGPFEFDYGYVRPASSTISLSNIVPGSRVLVTKDSDGSVLYNDLPGTSLSFSTTHIGNFNVVVRKASASPYYREFQASGTTVANQTTAIKCLQQLDE